MRVSPDPKSEPPGLVSGFVRAARREAALSPEIEAEFQRYRFDKALPVTRLTLVMGTALYSAFAFLDKWIVPGAVWPVWAIRAGFCTMSMLVFGLTFSRFFRHYAQPILAAITLLAGLGIVAIIALADQAGGALYYAGLILVLFMAYTLLQLRSAYVTVTCILIMAAYEWLAVIKATPALILLSNNFFFFSANAIGMLAGYTLERSVRTDFLQRRVIETQRQEADKLLRNVLPEDIARRLKADAGAIADYVPDVTVLFADFVGFTTLCERLAPAALLHLLNEMFTAFDLLADKHGLEKIKTIGDAYMIAGGVPRQLEGHCEAVAEMALEMLDATARLEKKLGLPLRIRIGIHCGPVIAGVIGLKKLSYDLWGDTVNTASRLETHGLPGSIQVSHTLRERLRGKFEFEDRGVIELKGKGPVGVFLLTGVAVSPHLDAPSPVGSARKSPRFHVRMPVSVLVEGRTLPGTLADVSAGGLFVWVGEEVSATRVLVQLASSPTPGMESLDVEGRVLHTRLASDGRWGLGIAIDRAESRGQIPLRDFLLLFFGTHAERAEGTVTGSDGTAFHYELASPHSRLTRAGDSR